MRRLTRWLASLALLASCAQGPLETAYAPALPGLPKAWEGILGKPCWRLEWIEEGNWVSWEGSEGFPELSLMREWTSPVLAWPFWPEKGLPPGLMRPAGALFPWDVSGEDLVFTWEAGVDAFFWRELAGEAEKSPGTPRFPWYFDWPGFRELMKNGNIPREIRENPWLADWRDIAGKTLESGFDRRRVKEEARAEITVPHPGGLWAGSSPFAEPVEVSPEEPLVLKTTESPDTWVSPGGLLRCQKEAWIFIPWPD